MRPSLTTPIARPPDAVFAYIADPAKLHTWQDVRSIEQITPGPVGVGTRFREEHVVLGRARTEITEITGFEPGRRFEIQMIDGPPVDGRWDFAPAGDGTRLTFTPTARLKGRLRFARPLVEALAVLGFRRFHGRLKRALENEPIAGW
jgi:hypothetical protein